MSGVCKFGRGESSKSRDCRRRGGVGLQDRRVGLLLCVTRLLDDNLVSSEIELMTCEFCLPKLVQPVIAVVGDALEILSDDESGQVVE